MPHVVHVYKDYWPPIVGGIERCIHWMAHGVRAIDPSWETTVLVNSRSRETRERTDGDVRVVEVGEIRRVASAPLSPGFPAAMKRLRADLWHFHIPNPTGDVSWLLARPKGRVVATYHSDVVRQKWAMAAYGPLLRAFMRRCDRVMPTSPRLIDCSPYLSAVRERCTPVPLGLPLARFDRTVEAGSRAREVKRRYGHRPLVVFVGKLRYYKGIHHLLAAMPMIPGADLVAIGSGPMEAELKAEAVRLGVAERVHFLGELPDDDVVAHLHAGDVFAFPSHLTSEAYGLAQIEAMASGLPVVCCDLPTGVPWVSVDGETGLVVPPANPEALARALADLLQNANRRLAMGEAAYRRARAEFGVERMAERVLGVYREVTSSPSR